MEAANGWIIPTEMSSFTHAMKLKFTPETLHDKRYQLITPWLWLETMFILQMRHRFCRCHRELNIEVMNELPLSKRLAVESFKLVTPLEPKIWHGLWLSLNRTLCACSYVVWGQSLISKYLQLIFFLYGRSSL